MECVLAELKNDTECYLKEKVDEWLIELPYHLYIFYNTVIDILWKANSQRYKGILERNHRDQKIS